MLYPVVKTVCFIFAGLILLGGLILVSMTCYDGIMDGYKERVPDAIEYGRIPVSPSNGVLIEHTVSEDVALLDEKDVQCVRLTTV